MNKHIPVPLRYYPLWLLFKGLSVLPLRVLYVLSDGLYLLVYYVFGYRKKVVLQNLQNAFPEKNSQELKQITKAFYRQLTDVIVEILRLGSMSRTELKRRLRFANQELLDDFVQQGKPVITMGSHSGNWEWILSAGAVQFGFPAEGVYKPLNNSFFEALMLHLRSRLGARLIRMRDTLRDFVQHRHVPRVIAMLSDQTPMRHEITFWTSFLHQDTPFYTGAEKLARRFGYPVLFLDVKRTSRGHYTLTFELIYDGSPENKALAADEHYITRTFAHKLEAAIRHAPADYLWTHRRWKHSRPEAVNPDLL